MAYSLNLTFGFEATDFTRIYQFDVDDSVAKADIVNAIQAINASLSGGNSDGLDEFFVADDFDGTNGKFSGIIHAETRKVTDNVIYTAGGGN